MRALLVILSLFAFMNFSYAAPYKGDARSARIPAGTSFQLQLMQTIDTMANQEGDTCNFILLNDQKYQNNIILPAGSIVRGSIARIKTAKICSRGAVLYIDFDHIVTPTGRQVPLSLAFVGLNKVTYDGGIYNSQGYGEAVQKNWEKCVDITKVSTNYGLKAGESAPGIQFVTCPVCALGGGIGGAGYLIGDSVIDLFRKGQEVTFVKGTKFQTKLTQPIDIPVN